MTKKCFYCASVSIVRNGHKGHIQRHLYKSCGKRFIIRKVVDSEALWRDYVLANRPYFNLVNRMGLVRTLFAVNFTVFVFPALSLHTKVLLF